MHDPNLLVGQTLAGKYQVKRLIGQGGMGAVFEGSNIEIGKRLAIKTIDQGHAMSGELATRLKREARAAAAVESNHIVQVFDVGDDPKCGVFMVMEFLQGEDLASKLSREGKLDVSTATSIALQVGRALVKAHGAGIVHRDLKPGNVFLTEREEGGLLVKVVDFGISKLLRDDVVGEQRNLTRMGTALGTPQYMSPEQAAGNQQIDHRTDVWALGCLLFEMLAGKPPYDDAGSYEMTIVRILTTRPPPVLSVAPWVPPNLAGVIDRALGYEWASRTPDAATLVRQLSEAVHVEPSLGTGRFSAISVPGYGQASAGHEVVRVSNYASPPGTAIGIGVQQRPQTPIPADLGATMPMTGDHEALVQQARAAAAQSASGGYAQPQHQSGGYQAYAQGGSGGYAVHPGDTGPRKPISTGTAVVVAPAIATPTYDEPAPSHEIAGVPSKSGSTLLFVGVGALVVALGVGAFVMFGGSSKPSDDKTTTQTTSKPIETAAASKKDKEEAKADKQKDPPKEEEPAPRPTATATQTATAPTTVVKTVPVPTVPNTKLGTKSGIASKTGTSATITAPSTTQTGTTTGKSLGGAGVSSDY